VYTPVPDPRLTRRYSARQWKIVALFVLTFLVAGCGSEAGAQIHQFSPLSRATATPQATLTAQVTPTPTATQPANNPQNAQLAARIDALFTNLVARHQFSGSVLIARGGQIILEKGYSMASWESKVANTPDTRFFMGSVSKEFTAMAILILQERGKLHVTDHLCSYVPHCPAPWQPVTIHELLTHTSGIPDLDAFQLPMSSLAAWIGAFDNVALEFPAGSRFHYCNTCYKLLAYVVQSASGTPYSQFVQQNIFDPLGMSETTFDSSKYYSQANDAIGYASWRVPAVHLGFSAAPEWSFLAGSGLLHTNAKNLYLWDQALYTHNLVSQHSLDEAFTPYVTANLFADSKYGYGWFISHSPIPGHPLIWHDGVIDGFRNYIGRYIDDHVTIIITSNLATIDSPALAHSVQQIIFGR
jgi:CubicO group peptidase (beta-lactamase class C family)